MFLKVNKKGYILGHYGEPNNADMSEYNVRINDESPLIDFESGKYKYKIVDGKKVEVAPYVIKKFLGVSYVR